MNKDKAAHYFRRAMDQGNSTAIFNYTRMHRYADGVVENKKLARKLLEEAIEEGNVGAIASSASMHRNGEGVL